MEKGTITVLLTREAQSLFDMTAPKKTGNIDFIVAMNTGDLINSIYIHNPDFIVFNISNLTEEDYISLARLKNERDKAKYQLLFIHDREEASDIVAALREGLNQYWLKLLNTVEKNAQILNFLELRHDREEMRIAYSELHKATLEMNKKNRQLQMAINNLEKLTVSDYLTGAYNRRYILERIRQEIVRYNRNKNIFSFVICDIDNFKKVNDIYGHAFGDQVVADTAKCLLDSCREMDVLSRWGGDEFLFLLAETDLNGALIFCERIKNIFEQKVFEYDDVKIKVSLTFGVAEYDPREGYKESIKNADDALLSGKSNGRNKVVAFKGNPSLK